MKSFQDRFWLSLATCGGIGYLPIAPGTWASAVAVVFWWALQQHLGFSFYEQLAMLVVLLVGGVLSTKPSERALGSHDDSRMVIDEWVGVGIPILISNFSFFHLFLSFILFRIFDIWKPLGIRYFDRRAFAGWGVMLDDVLAGIYAAVLLGGMIHYGWI